MRGLVVEQEAGHHLADTRQGGAEAPSGQIQQRQPWRRLPQGARFIHQHLQDLATELGMLAHGPHHVAHRVGGEAAIEAQLMHPLAEVLQRLLLLLRELGAAGSVDLHDG